MSDDALSRVELALVDDPGGRTVWHQLLDCLSGELRVAVTSASAEGATRWRRSLPTIPGIEWVWVEPEADGVGLGGAYRLLGTHALVFLTPVTSPLGQHDRQLLEQLEVSGPSERAVWLADVGLLERLSDDPEAELQQVVSRLDGLLDEGWRVQPELEAWLTELQRDPELRGHRRLAVAERLIADRIAREQAQIDNLQAAIDAVQQRLDSEDAQLRELEQRSRRWAAHTLAILKRQTEQLALDLAEHLRQVEASLPEQIAGVEDIALLRRSLPHWLSHVVQSWLEDRVARWRQQVVDELDALELEDPLDAELIVPALQPGLLRGDTRWAQRLATTAAFGGAAALLALGLWIPSLLAVAGGIAWSTAQRGNSEAEERRAMLASAREALRQLGEDADRLLQEQLQQLETELQAATALPQTDAVREVRERLSTELDGLRAELEPHLARLAELSDDGGPT